MRPLAERLYDIRHWSEFERGGHFAAMEVPELLAQDIQDFFLTRLDQDQLRGRFVARPGSLHLSTARGPAAGGRPQRG